MRVTIIADDKTVTVNGASAVLQSFPPLDANVHAIQFFPEIGHATIEKKAGESEHIAADAALALVKPFVEAYDAESMRLEAVRHAAAVERKAAEQAVKHRHDRIRADLAAADRKAAQAVLAAEAERQREATAVPTRPGGNMASSGTQTI